MLGLILFFLSKSGYQIEAEGCSLSAQTEERNGEIPTTMTDTDRQRKGTPCSQARAHNPFRIRTPYLRNCSFLVVFLCLAPSNQPSAPLAFNFHPKFYPIHILHNQGISSHYTQWETAT